MAWVVLEGFSAVLAVLIASVEMEASAGCGAAGETALGAAHRQQERSQDGAICVSAAWRTGFVSVDRQDYERDHANYGVSSCSIIREHS